MTLLHGIEDVEENEEEANLIIFMTICESNCLSNYGQGDHSSRFCHILVVQVLFNKYTILKKSTMVAPTQSNLKREVEK